jgi:tRNA(Ile)-lysidine synthase
VIAGGDLSAKTQARLLVLAHRCCFAPEPVPLNLAVSGGPDSLAMLVLACLLGRDVTAWHVDHGLRPGSDSEVALVAEVAAKYGARFESLKVYVEPGPNLEARAREARYRVLPADVATAHTADDQAETILINLMRGAGLDGLAGMRLGPRHPLLRLRRSETEEVCRLVGLVPFRDPTNSDPRFWRNRVRSELLPLMAEISSRDPVTLICRTAELLAAEAAFLDLEASKLDPTDAKAVAQAPIALARRALRRWIQGNGQHPPAWRDVGKALLVATGKRRGAQLAGGAFVKRSRGRLVLVEGASGGLRGT